MAKKKTLTDAAKDVFKVLNEDGPAMATLHPKTGFAAPEQSIGGPAAMIQAPTVPGEDPHAGEIAASLTPGKAQSKVNANASDVPLGQVHNNADIDPDLENNTPNDNFGISEELMDFINQKIAEGLTDEEISAAIAENFEEVETSTVEEEIEPVDMSEHIEALFDGENLSEDFKNKAKVIFEAAVKSVMESELEKYKAAYVETLKEEVDQIEEVFAGQIDDFLSLIAEEWSKENEIALESNLRTELSESVLVGLKKLLEENYIDVPADKVDVLEVVSNDLAETSQKLNEEIEKTVELTKIVNEQAKQIAINEATIGLSVAQGEKLRELAEAVTFDTTENFNKKVQTLKESYFKTVPSTESVLDPVESVQNGQMINESEDKTLNAVYKVLSKQAKR